MRGGIGDDDLHGGAGADLIFGNEGGDTVHAGGGDDIVLGDNGDVTEGYRHGGAPWFRARAGHLDRWRR